MLESDRFDAFEVTDVNKTHGLHECIICHYWYFLETKFKFQPEVCNGCHDLIQKVMNFNDVAVVFVKGNGYRIHFWYMSKDEVI